MGHEKVALNMSYQFSPLNPPLLANTPDPFNLDPALLQREIGITEWKGGRAWDIQRPGSNLYIDQHLNGLALM